MGKDENKSIDKNISLKDSVTKDYAADAKPSTSDVASALGKLSEWADKLKIASDKYASIVKKAKEGVSDEFTVTVDAAADVQYFQIRGAIINEREVILPRIAKELHKYFKENGIESGAYPESDLIGVYSTTFDNAYCGKYDKIRMRLGYFTPKMPRDLSTGGEFKCDDASRTITYDPAPVLNYYYTNSDIEYFDPEYARMCREIAEYEEDLKSSQSAMECAVTDRRNFSLGSAIGSLIKGLIKGALCFAIALVPFSLAGKILMSVLPDAVGLIIGALIGIGCFIKLCISWEVWDNLTDITMVSDAKKDYERARRALESTHLRGKSIDELKNSEAFREAKERNERLRAEDLAFAEKWQKDWFDFIKMVRSLKI